MFPLDDPKPWRAKADELRAAAQSSRSLEAQRTLSRLASDCDLLARQIEASAKLMEVRAQRRRLA
jgi:hypothetical protein